jgi:hypothetical protein
MLILPLFILAIKKGRPKSPGLLMGIIVLFKLGCFDNSFPKIMNSWTRNLTHNTYSEQTKMMKKEKIYRLFIVKLGLTSVVVAKSLCFDYRFLLELSN